MAKILQMAVMLGSSKLGHGAFGFDERSDSSPVPQMKRELPTRKMCLEAFKRTHYDILIIGGGAVGSGCALDAATRGLKTALVEANDFGSGTSSKSSKHGGTVHGGLRDLERAVSRLDVAAFRRVRCSLRERRHISNLAPHLSQPVPILLPVHHWWEAPLYYLKLRMYHLMAPKGTKSFQYLSADDALQVFPMLRREELFGAFVFYEGQHDDARMCLSVALTAARYGADICNHMKVVRLIKNKDGNVAGAEAVDQLTGKKYSIRAKVVVNATGHMSDSVRRMEDSEAKPLCTRSWSSILVLPRFYCPEEVGVFDPHTPSGRSIFFLPWQGHTLVGSSDESENQLGQDTQPSETDIQSLLDGVKLFFSPNFDVRRCDVLAVWGGFKPSKADFLDPTPLKSHVIQLGPRNMLSIVGTSWSSFRALAEKTVNTAIRLGDLSPLRTDSVTAASCKLDGASGWSPKMFIRLVQDFGMEPDVAEHLSNTYGSNAFKVAVSANSSGMAWPIVGKRLHSEFPYIEAEVKQGVRDFACTLEDMVARRLRVAFLNVQVAEEILPQVANIMAKELRWTREQTKMQIRETRAFLNTQMGQLTKENASRMNIPIKMSVGQVRKFATQFRQLDENRTGYVSVAECCKAMKTMGVKEVPVDLMHNVLRDIDVHAQGKVNLYEFLLLMSAIVQGDTEYLRYARLYLDHKKQMHSSDYPTLMNMEQTGSGL
ncbi:glycerol-3-phosphate dehydrogenase, mitochondrial [Drosophila ficusphila]|uniref:glycerol-3-phosphate dehydrogenase, mitochondrial n=1 Tax=Drosophila ficusphila TaxID=30025 RepID=UPI0007E6CE7C|nr:glycerol-3-phosphate dehydrogenase, mitochondrial [Drosophila ficusphila]